MSQFLTLSCIANSVEEFHTPMKLLYLSLRKYSAMSAYLMSMKLYQIPIELVLNNLIL